MPDVRIPREQFDLHKKKMNFTDIASSRLLRDGISFKEAMEVMLMIEWRFSFPDVESLYI